MSNLLILSLVALLGLAAPAGPGTASPGNGPAAAWPRPARVISRAIPVYEAPQGQSRAVEILAAGSQLEVLEKAGPWYQVRLDDGRTGWVRERAILLTGRDDSPSPLPGSSSALLPDPIPFPPGAKVAIYYVWDPTRSQVLSAALTPLRSYLVLVPWAFRLGGDGRLSLSLPAASLGGILREVGEAGGDTWLLVHNFNGRTFDAAGIDRLLRSKAARARAVEQMRREAARWGVNGVHLDLEAVPPADRNRLTGFVAEVARALHADGRLLTVALPAKLRDESQSAWAGAYDYRDLGRIADAVTIMTYDEHYPGSAPGPVASLPWMEKVVAYATARIPPRKILLGIAGYGYEWSPDGKARTLAFPQVESLLRAGATGGWEEAQKAPFLRYQHQPSGSWRTVWYQDRRSTSFQLSLVGRYGLAGIAFWRLGMEDPSVWQEVRLRHQP